MGFVVDVVLSRCMNDWEYELRNHTSGGATIFAQKKQFEVLRGLCQCSIVQLNTTEDGVFMGNLEVFRRKKCQQLAHKRANAKQ